MWSKTFLGENSMHCKLVTTVIICIKPKQNCTLVEIKCKAREIHIGNHGKKLARAHIQRQKNLLIRSKVKALTGQSVNRIKH